VIALVAAVVILAAVTGLILLAIVIASVRREDRASRLPVEASGPITAVARRITGLHVRTTTRAVTGGRTAKTARR
jgi:hypothetical protein